MNHNITLSDEQQRIVTELARAHGQSPQERLQTLLEDAWERECAQYDAAFENDPDWLAGAQEAIAELDTGKRSFFPSTEAFLQHLQHLRTGESDTDATPQRGDKASPSLNDANS